MPKVSGKRENLISAAIELIHRQGYHQTTLADIAHASGVPLGNVYYYFKTKTQIVEAVIAQRREATQVLHHQCEQAGTPAERIIAFMQAVLSDVEQNMLYGCPVGSLCMELRRLEEDAELARKINEVLLLNVTWLEKNFSDMNVSQSRDKGMYVISVMQGAMLLTKSAAEEGIMKRQINELIEWVKSL